MKAWPAKMDVVGWKASLQRYSMPNAFLAASGPGHPFWIHYVDDIRYHWAMADIDFSSVETVTGPIALWRSANVWHDQENAVLEVLTPGRIYPFTWNSYRHGERCVCLAGREPEFDPQRCNLLFPDAWTITCQYVHALRVNMLTFHFRLAIWLDVIVSRQLRSTLFSTFSFIRQILHSSPECG